MSNEVIRKRKVELSQKVEPERSALNLATLAEIVYSSEDPLHPVENVFDSATGPGGSKWCSESAGTTEQIVLEFDKPQSFSRLIYEAEETEYARTQEVSFEASDDGGRSFRQLLRQEFSFSPEGATFEHEDLELRVPDISHLRCVIIPNKQGNGRASLTTLQLFP